MSPRSIGVPARVRAVELPATDPGDRGLRDDTVARGLGSDVGVTGDTGGDAARVARIATDADGLARAPRADRAAGRAEVRDAAPTPRARPGVGARSRSEPSVGAARTERTERTERGALHRNAATAVARRIDDLVQGWTTGSDEKAILRASRDFVLSGRTTRERDERATALAAALGRSYGRVVDELEDPADRSAFLALTLAGATEAQKADAIAELTARSWFERLLSWVFGFRDQRDGVREILEGYEDDPEGFRALFDAAKDRGITFETIYDALPEERLARERYVSMAAEWLPLEERANAVALLVFGDTPAEKERAIRTFLERVPEQHRARFSVLLDEKLRGYEKLSAELGAADRAFLASAYLHPSTVAELQRRGLPVFESDFTALRMRERAAPAEALFLAAERSARALFTPALRDARAVLGDPFAEDADRAAALATYEAWSRDVARQSAAFIADLDAELSRTSTFASEYRRIIAGARAMIEAHPGDDPASRLIREDSKRTIAFAEKEREKAFALTTRLTEVRAGAAGRDEAVKPTLERGLELAKRAQPLLGEHSALVAARDAGFRRIAELRAELVEDPSKARGVLAELDALTDETRWLELADRLAVAAKDLRDFAAELRARAGRDPQLAAWLESSGFSTVVQAELDALELALRDTGAYVDHAQRAKHLAMEVESQQVLARANTLAGGVAGQLATKNDTELDRAARKIGAHLGEVDGVLAKLRQEHRAAKRTVAELDGKERRTPGEEARLAWAKRLLAGELPGRGNKPVTLAKRIQGLEAARDLLVAAKADLEGRHTALQAGLAAAYQPFAELGVPAVGGQTAADYMRWARTVAANVAIPTLQDDGTTLSIEAMTLVDGERVKIERDKVIVDGKETATIDGEALRVEKHGDRTVLVATLTLQAGDTFPKVAAFVDALAQQGGALQVGMYEMMRHQLIVDPGAPHDVELGMSDASLSARGLPPASELDPAKLTERFANMKDFYARALGLEGGTLDRASFAWTAKAAAGEPTATKPPILDALEALMPGRAGVRSDEVYELARHLDEAGAVSAKGLQAIVSDPAVPLAVRETARKFLLVPALFDAAARDGKLGGDSLRLFGDDRVRTFESLEKEDGTKQELYLAYFDRRYWPKEALEAESTKGHRPIPTFMKDGHEKADALHRALESGQHERVRQVVEGLTEGEREWVLHEFTARYGEEAINRLLSNEFGPQGGAIAATYLTSGGRPDRERWVRSTFTSASFDRGEYANYSALELFRRRFDDENGFRTDLDDDLHSELNRTMDEIGALTRRHQAARGTPAAAKIEDELVVKLALANMLVDALSSDLSAAIDKWNATMDTWAHRSRVFGVTLVAVAATVASGGLLAKPAAGGVGAVAATSWATLGASVAIGTGFGLFVGLGAEANDMLARGEWDWKKLEERGLEYGTAAFGASLGVGVSMFQMANMAAQSSKWLMVGELAAVNSATTGLSNYVSAGAYWALGKEEVAAKILTDTPRDMLRAGISVVALAPFSQFAGVGGRIADGFTGGAEQAAYNVLTGKDWHEGLPEAMVSSVFFGQLFEAHASKRYIRGLTGNPELRVRLPGEGAGAEPRWKVLGADEGFGVVLVGDARGNTRRVMAERLTRANPELARGGLGPHDSDPGPGKVHLPKESLRGLGDELPSDGWEVTGVDLTRERVRARRVVSGETIDVDLGFGELTHTPGGRKRLQDLTDGEEFRTGDLDERRALFDTFFRNERERRIDGVPDADPPDKYQGTPNTMLDSDLMRGVTYLRTHRERAPYKVTIENGRLYGANGKPLDTSSFESHWAGSGSAIFVMSKSGELYVSPQEVGKFHHSSLLGGADVAAAGTMTVENGRIVEISDQSGHYRPPAEITAQVLGALKGQGVDLSRITVASSYLTPGHHPPLVTMTAQDFLDQYSRASTGAGGRP